MQANAACGRPLEHQGLGGNARFSLMFPELIWNILGTLWAYELGEVMPRCAGEAFTSTVIKGVLIFNWLSLVATILGMALLFDPLGSARYYAPCDGGANCLEDHHEQHAQRSRAIWQRRFAWLFCWMRPDEHSRTAFHDVASLFSALFRSTDLVPSDVASAFVLLRVKQKREVRMQREKLAKSRGNREWTQHFPTHAQGISPPLSLDEDTRVIGAAEWMKLSIARHYLRLSMAAYGWPLVMYLHCFTGFFRLLPYMACCGCMRSKTPRVVEDNCCLCNVAGMRSLSGVPAHDILYASFRNRLFEVPFLVVADHSTKSIVVVMRGSISLRDIFTDFTAASYELEAPELPPNCKGHKGMIHVAQYVLRTLQQESILTEAFESHPEYNLIVTGHSLGAGVAVLLGLMLKPTYPDLKCYAFAAPGGLLCPEAAAASESFTLTVGLGDDLVMRLGVDSIENLRTDLLTAIRCCMLPKYRVLLSGFMYVLFGVPDHVLEQTWEIADEKLERIPTKRYRAIHKLVMGPPTSIEASRLACNVGRRRFSEQRLFSPGKILHITRCKSSGPSGNGRRRHHELRWAGKEHFTQLRVMPRMILDHLPENILAAMDNLLAEHEEQISNNPDSIEVSS
ncbi:diacylglycerol lipase-beta-like isoform X2 [Neocloeon triangulifer]|uniref:diacylglycerol lipase-beta-like isoform X2 n=1 Tax=Neocloeon triangulifer TaxID=2078957 RepID=UPI00286F6D61|nr:diacylglycerol lipase-beta-like isoform X2 [Neocloeon triangulifer]